MTDLLSIIPEQFRTRDVASVANGLADNDCATVPVLLDALRDADATDADLRRVLVGVRQAFKGSDTPRLVYADFLEERGEVDRAEFVRVQVELARIGHHHPAADRAALEQPDRKDLQCECHELRRRELWVSIGVDLFNSSCIVFDHHTVKQFTSGTGFSIRRVGGGSDEVHWSRGFISSVTCSWADWLRHHERLYWSPGQTVECTCRPGHVGWCYRCKNAFVRGRIPRPLTDDLAATCQPLEVVHFSSIPVDGSFTNWLRAGGEASFELEDATGRAYRFTREKCPTCGGRGTVRREVYPPFEYRMVSSDMPAVSRGRIVEEDCPCRHTPPSRWHCDAWPGLVFVMPEQARRSGYLQRTPATDADNLGRRSTFTGAFSSDLSDPRNWERGQVPEPGDAVYFGGR